MANDNIIDINDRLKSNRGSQTAGAPIKEASSVVDMTERRQEIIRSERRAAKRTVLTQFMGAFVVIPQRGLQKVDLYDISKKGVSFDLPFEAGQLEIGETIAMRFYMNQNTYFAFDIKITNGRSIPEEGISRQGSSFIYEDHNKEPLGHLINFIESVSLQLQLDKGDLKITNK